MLSLYKNSNFHQKLIPLIFENNGKNTVDDIFKHFSCWNVTKQELHQYIINIKEQIKQI